MVFQFHPGFLMLLKSQGLLIPTLAAVYNAADKLLLFLLKHKVNLFSLSIYFFFL